MQVKVHDGNTMRLKGFIHFQIISPSSIGWLNSANHIKRERERRQQEVK